LKTEIAIDCEFGRNSLKSVLPSASVRGIEQEARDAAGSLGGDLFRGFSIFVSQCPPAALGLIHVSRRPE